MLVAGDTTLRVGRRVVIPTAPLLVMLGVSQQCAEEAIDLEEISALDTGHDGMMLGCTEGEQHGG